MTPDGWALVVSGLVAWVAVETWAKPKRTPIFGWITKGKGGILTGAFGTGKKKRKKGRKR